MLTGDRLAVTAGSLPGFDTVRLYAAPMPIPWKHVRTILTEVPVQGKLAYCLLRDRRVPRAPKVALLLALGLILAPIDLPGWVPLFGELDMLALGILAVKTFVEACPEELVTEHRAAIKRRGSTWDDDRQAVFGLLRSRATRLLRRAS